MSRRAWLVASVALAVAFAWPMQVNGWNQNAHYALVRALADGKPWIDRTMHEIGELSTGDIAEYRGHTYAAKAPGLAFASLPAFLVVEATGMRTTGDPTRVIWALHLWGVALAALLVVLVVRLLGDRLEPGFGAAAAVTAGLGTLVLPFGTLFFSHVLAALLGLAAFALLWRERDRPPRLLLVAVAGLLAGLAVVVEYPLALAGAVLGIYAVSRGDVLRRGGAYAVGALAGVAPLLAFNVWAFGSPTHIAYEDYYAGGRAAGGVFGFGLPSAAHAHDLLVSSMGVLTITPVVACAVVGAILLARTQRPEALVLLGIGAAYFLYNVSLRYASPFGGLGPPRYLVTIMPFLGVALAVAFRRFPLTTLALGVVSAFQMAVMTATGPLAAYDGRWLSRLADREVVQTAAAIVDVTGWYTIAAFLVAVLAAAAAAAASTRLAPSRRELPVALCALLGWGLIAATASNPNGSPPGNRYVLAAVVIVGALTTALALAASVRTPLLAGSIGAALKRTR
jgi:hypothetical protein